MLIPSETGPLSQWFRAFQFSYQVSEWGKQCLCCWDMTDWFGVEKGQSRAVSGHSPTEAPRPDQNMQIWFLKTEHFLALALLCCIAFLHYRFCTGGCLLCTHTCVVCAITKAGLGSYREHYQLVIVFILSVNLSIDCPFIYNLIVALLHQPLIYYNLEATQKESLNLFPSAPKNGELIQVQ